MNTKISAAGTEEKTNALRSAFPDLGIIKIYNYLFHHTVEQRMWKFSTAVAMLFSTQ